MSNAAQARFQKKTLIHKAAQIRILPNRKINPFGKGGVVLESPGRPAIAVNSDNEIPLIRNDCLCKWRMESRDRLDIGARGHRPPRQAALRHLEMTRREFFFAQAIFLRSLWSVKPIIYSLIGRVRHFVFRGRPGVKNVVSPNAVGG